MPRLLLAAAVIGMGVFIAAASLANAQSTAQKDAPGKEAPPDVPDAIAVPAGLEPVLFAHGSGAQTYTCQAGAEGKFAWTLKGPEAELKDRKDKVIGEHLADPASKLPTWKLKDGSEVTGKAAAHVDALDPESVPWLLVTVVSNGGKGQLASVTSIQRVHTHGGQPPGYGCDESHKDAETKSSYTADYYFFAPAK
ncbi:MAG: DUF3455 domain-containing protein [Candidatus Sulfotelmatobacter sp.]|jgi:hypothetical protein